jgi:alpha-L-fucosidase 2
MKTYQRNRNSIRLAIMPMLIAFAVRVPAQSQGEATAWKAGHFHVNVPGVVDRSDIVLKRPNVSPGEAMPLGNGSVGVALWSAGGFTAQLNRGDTLPDRLSAGQLVLPGLALLTRANDYSGRLKLYDGEFQEHGGGMTATAYVQPATDTLVIDVTGAKANETQTAQLKLWTPRTPKAVVNGPVGMMMESWIDNQRPESSGRPFGSLAAITAQGRDVRAEVTDSLTITLSFRPFADGHFRVMMAAPHYDGGQDASSKARAALTSPSLDAHSNWWHNYWHNVGMIKITSQDGVGEYMESLRNIYLFSAAAEKGTEYPGSQAGVADMLSSARDAHRWDSSSFWHWNLRMQVAANIGAGVPELNDPYFNLYRENLSSIEDWTKRYMNGLIGACVPETMRFNGRGIEYEASWKPVSIGRDCDLGFKPYYNSRTLTTGAEVSLWIWQQYLMTRDRAFLAENYPVMAASARFLLAFQKPGRDGLLHTSPSNAHETQWDVIDPTTDIAACMALYPVVTEAAKLLGKDPALVKEMQAALVRLPPFPRTQPKKSLTLLLPSADVAGDDVIAESYMPAASHMNAENIGLEPVWPYDLIGDTSPLFALAKRTYEDRPHMAVADWSFDPIQAARLQLGSEVGETLKSITERSQHSVNGLANWDKEYGEFYIEQVGVVADALQEALVQDYDGVIRLAPAIPPGWDFDGSVFVRDKTKVDVQVRGGSVVLAVIEAGSAQQIEVRNPWPGETVDVVAASGARERVVKSDAAKVISFSAIAGISYLLRRAHAPVTGTFNAISGMPASAVKTLGRVQIGLAADDTAHTSGRK